MKKKKIKYLSGRTEMARFDSLMKATFNPPRNWTLLEDLKFYSDELTKKDAEMLRERIQTLETMKNAELISTYFSKQWVMKNVLRMTDDDIEDMKKQLEDEQRGGESETEEEPQEESKIQNISLESQDEFVDELEEERKILEIQTKEKELQVLENVAKSLASG